MKRIAAVLACTLALACPARGTAQELDSQLVLERYAAALAGIAAPKAVVFNYSVSQAGPHNLEQTHTIFRVGTLTRDQTTSVDGDAVTGQIRILSRSDRYAIVRLAPRVSEYSLLFLGARRNGKHLDYTYAAAPYAPAGPFTVTEVTIDGVTYLPNLIRFVAIAEGVKANGSIAYAKFGKYWMPTLALVSAKIDGKPARERIAWGGYAFPATLPPSTFAQPKPVALPTIAPF
ncbi:MAG: hypothetical protein JOZ38_12380 [Candidatus Eremiobacteraeota bacterium]|nr:hypothetical protein [Candidatus Eremiobacteraeota bacterium]